MYRYKAEAPAPCLYHPSDATPVDAVILAMSAASPASMISPAVRFNTYPPVASCDISINPLSPTLALLIVKAVASAVSCTVAFGLILASNAIAPALNVAACGVVLKFNVDLALALSIDFRKLSMSVDTVTSGMVNYG